jgi:hypothetical protein
MSMVNEILDQNRSQVSDLFSNVGQYFLGQGLQKIGLTSTGVQTNTIKSEQVLNQTNPYSSELMRSNLFGVTGGDPKKNIMLIGGVLVLGFLVVYAVRR